MDWNTYRTVIIPVPDHIIGGPFWVQTICNETGKVVSLRTGLASRERAECVAYDYRHGYPQHLVALRHGEAEI